MLGLFEPSSCVTSRVEKKTIDGITARTYNDDSDKATTIASTLYSNLQSIANFPEALAQLKQMKQDLQTEASANIHISYITERGKHIGSTAIQIARITGIYRNAIHGFFENECIRGGINSAACDAWLYVFHITYDVKCLRFLGTIMAHARNYEGRSGKLKAIKALSEQPNCDASKLMQLKKAFFAERELNFNLNPDANVACLALRDYLSKKSGIAKPLQVLLYLIENQSQRVALTRQTPLRGSDHLWIANIFRDFATLIAGNEDICKALFALKKLTDSTKKSQDQATPSKDYEYKNITYQVMALPSGSGEIPCFKVSTSLFGTDKIAMLLKLYIFTDESTPGKTRVKKKSNSLRKHYASDILQIKAIQTTNSIIESIELQEWLQGTQLSKLAQTKFYETWALIQKLVKYVAEIHEQAITMTDLTLSNLWLLDSGHIVVADKKSLHDLSTDEHGSLSDRNPTVASLHCPHHTPCYLATTTDFIKSKGSFHYQPYNLCNQALAMCMVYLIDSCYQQDMSGQFKLPKPAGPRHIDTVFEDMYKRVTTNELIYLERLRAHIDELASNGSDRYTAQHIVKHMDALPDPQYTLHQPSPTIPHEEAASLSHSP